MPINFLLLLLAGRNIFYMHNSVGPKDIRNQIMLSAVVDFYLLFQAFL